MIQQYRFIARLGWGTFGVPQSPRPSVPYSHCVQCDSCLGRGKTQQFRPIVVAHFVTALLCTQPSLPSPCRTYSRLVQSCPSVGLGWVEIFQFLVGWVGLGLL